MSKKYVFNKSIKKSITLWAKDLLFLVWLKNALVEKGTWFPNTHIHPSYSTA